MDPQTPQGNWWLASDGRWYPPELHPNSSQTQPPASGIHQPSAPQTPAGPPQYLADGPSVAPQQGAQYGQPSQFGQPVPQGQSPDFQQIPQSQTNTAPPLSEQTPQEPTADAPGPMPQQPAQQSSHQPVQQLPQQPAQEPAQQLSQQPPQQPPQSPHTPPLAQGYGQQPPNAQFPPTQSPQYVPANQYGNVAGYTTPYAYGAQGASPAYGQAPPVQINHAKKQRNAVLLTFVACVVVLSLIAVAVGLVLTRSDQTIAVGDGAVSANPLPDGSSRKDDVPPASVEDIVGLEDDDIGEVAAAAIADLKVYWKDAMPEAYNMEFEPLAGGFVSASPDEPAPPCVDSYADIEDNAYYCGLADVIVWDDTKLFPRLQKEYGDLTLALVLAHEWGHAVQERVDFKGKTVTWEQGADCMAGAWVRWVADDNSKYFTAEGKQLDRALAGFLELADVPGTSADDPLAHGSAFDRINAFQDGFENGSKSCAAYTDQSIAERLVDLSFTSNEDFKSGGNAPYKDIISFVDTDLEDYWNVTAPAVFDTNWDALSAPVAFDPDGDAPECGGEKVEDFGLFYCASDRYVGYDDVKLLPDVYTSIGDFAVATLYATQYSLGVQDTLGIDKGNAQEQNLRADCMVGAWMGSVHKKDRTNENNESSFVLSPGDFDEAVAILLSFSGEDDERGSGVERVNSFRKGVLDGIESCTN